MTKEKAEVLSCSLMATPTKVNLGMEEPMVKASTLGRMEKFMMESGLMVLRMVMEYGKALKTILT